MVIMLSEFFIYASGVARVIFLCSGMTFCFDLSVENSTLNGNFTFSVLANNETMCQYAKPFWCYSPVLRESNHNLHIELIMNTIRAPILAKRDISVFGQ
jgi:hypothetical protein